VVALFSAALVPAGVLLPIVGILSVTGEWAQRGALVTFALVPRRERVVAAKLLAVGIVALLTVDVCLGAAAAGHAVSVATGHGGGGSRITADALGEAMAGEVLLALLGVGFGLLLRSSTLAIAVYLVVPSAWSILAATVGWLHGWAGWLSLDAAVGPLQQGASLPAQGWARVAAVAGLWLLLPLLAGLARLARTEVG